jgi:two-component system, sensor histidine kinase and response regulator
MKVESAGLVLVVDDDPVNRELLHDLLEVKGYDIVEAANGTEALAAASDHEPDVILLDVMMPAPDGFEVCRQLKADGKTAAIPVLLVTALTDRDARLQGIRAGANDFLTKPIDTVDTVLRVQNAVHMKRLYDLSEERYRKQLELEETKEGLINMIVHDLKTPLISMTGYARLMERGIQDTGDPNLTSHLSRVVANGDRMLEMISSMLDVARMESGDLELQQEVASIGDILIEVEEILKPFQREGISFDFSCPVELKGYLDPIIVRRVLCNLGENALRSLPMSGGELCITVSEVNQALVFRVRDTGRGIPPEALERIFDKFGQVDCRAKHTHGLGLTFCKMAVEAHGGQIVVESELGQGTTFTFDIPSRESQQAVAQP